MSTVTQLYDQFVLFWFKSVLTNRFCSRQIFLSIQFLTLGEKIQSQSLKLFTKGCMEKPELGWNLISNLGITLHHGDCIEWYNTNTMSECKGYFMGFGLFELFQNHSIPFYLLLQTFRSNQQSMCCIRHCYLGLKWFALSIKSGSVPMEDIFHTRHM